MRAYLTRASPPAMAGVAFEAAAPRPIPVRRAYPSSPPRRRWTTTSDTYRFNQPQDLDFGPSSAVTLFLGADWSFVTYTMLDSPRKMRWQFMTPLDTTPTIFAYEAP